MRRKRSATLRLSVPPGSRGIRKVSWAPRPVRGVSDWVPGMDKRQRAARIILKSKRIGGFHQWANWVANVRNESRLRRQRNGQSVVCRWPNLTLDQPNEQV